MTQSHSRPSPLDNTSAMLTPQEQAVLTVSASGLSVDDVAQSLELSAEAVRAAIASAIAKLGASRSSTPSVSRIETA